MLRRSVPKLVLSLSKVVTAVWSYVDFLAKVSGAWIRLRCAKDEKDFRRALLLDYFSPLAIWTPIEALRNRDALIVGTSLVSLFLRVMIIFSSSLIRLKTVSMETPVEVRTAFVNDPSRLGHAGLMPIHTTVGVKRYKLDYPRGISNQFVYQLIEPHPNSTSELHATIEGFTTDLDCQSATLTDFNAQQWEGREDGPSKSWPTRIFNSSFGLGTSDCDILIPSQDFSFELTAPSSVTLDESAPVRSITRGVSRVLSGSCQSRNSTSSQTEPVSHRLVWVVADLLVHYSSRGGQNTTVDIILRNSQQIICQPSYAIHDLAVYRDHNGKESISLLNQSQPRHLSRINAWDITQAVIDVYDRISQDSDIRLTLRSNELAELNALGNLELDSLTMSSLALGQQTFPDYPSLLNYTALALSLRTYYQMHTKLLVHSSLTEPTRGSIVGTAKTRVDRLTVEALSPQVLVGLFMLSIAALFSAQSALPKKFTLSSDPRTILGLKALSSGFAYEPLWEPGDLEISRLKTEAQTQKPKNAAVTTSKFYQPVTVNPYLRIPVYFATLAVVILLEILLHKSYRDDGLGPAFQDRKYFSYLWTLLPVVGSSLLNLFFTLVDSDFRTLAPFHTLLRGLSPPHLSVKLNLRGLFGIHALWEEIKTQNFASAAATTASVLASLLTFASALLFFDADQSVVVEKQLRLVGSFTSDMHTIDYDVFTSRTTYQMEPMGASEVGIILSLMLQNNVSSPGPVYNDLIYPVFSLEGLDREESKLNESELEIRAVVPVLRGTLECHLLPDNEVMVDILHSKTIRNMSNSSTPDLDSWPAGDSIRVNIAGEYCESARISTPELAVTAVFALTDSRASEGVFGDVYPHLMPNTSRYLPYSQYLYVWGKYIQGTFDKPPSVTASALKCDAAVESVEVETTFFGTRLAIHPDRPPKVKEETKRVVVPPVLASRGGRITSTYPPLNPFRETEPGAFLDAFFSILATSQHTLPPVALFDKSRAPEVVEAIKRQHTIIISQTHNKLARIGYDGVGVYADMNVTDKGVFDRLGLGTLNDTTYPATVKVKSSRLDGWKETRRVFQDETATRIMQALLGTTIFFSLLSWALMPWTAILPRPPTSIANVLALLVDGNIFHVTNTEQSTPIESNDARNRGVVEYIVCIKKFGLVDMS
ncbi:hypothetical protein B0T21DRAFT_435386 [Apiosordaria backusii]|uniref:Uncharacterized protein n=1 Tax=Apiosordaria backusii TaxID=314023 RepID=A0AA40BRD1_9PEZI|nr:hypothetical protein B0T21DRAFT_435386 [Apiosordaria backusii]